MTNVTIVVSHQTFSSIVFFFFGYGPMEVFRHTEALMYNFTVPTPCVQFPRD